MYSLFGSNLAFAQFWGIKREHRKKLNDAPLLIQQYNLLHSSSLRSLHELLNRSPIIAYQAINDFTADNNAAAE